MAFGFAILAALLLLLVAFGGLGYYAIPIGIVGFLALGFLVANRAKRTGGAPGGGSESSKPQDSGGGPTHKREEYAHTGQAYMTPEQMKRARS